METGRATGFKCVFLLAAFLSLSLLWGTAYGEDDPNDFNQTMGVSYVSSGESPAGNSCGWEVIAVRNGTSEEGSDGGQLTIELNTCLIFSYTLERFPQSGGSEGTTDLQPDDLIIVWDEDPSHGESELQKNFTFSGTYSILEESDYEDYLRLSTTVDVTNWAVYCVETAGTFAKGSAGTNEHEVLKLCRNRMQFLKYDNISDANCVSPGDSITYTICFNNAEGQTLEGAFVLDWLPAGVDYDYILSLVPLVIDANYNPTDHSYLWDLTQIAPNTSGCVQLTVTANEKAVPGMYLHNVAELWGTVYDANGLNPESIVVARATEDTPVCCWDTSGILYVDEKATGAESGLNWQDAYTDLQDAITQATETTCAEAFTIYVAQGTYAPGEYADDSFVLPEGVSVYGGFKTGGCEFSERNPKRYETILTGLIDATHRNDTVMTMGDETLLDGVTVTDAAEYGVYGNGVDFSVENCVVEKSWYYGIRGANGNVTVKWCIIKENERYGIRHEGENFTLVVENCWIMKNLQYGIFCQNSTPYVLNSIVSESDLNEAGSAGILMFNPADIPVLYNNTFAHNKNVGISFMDNGTINDPNDKDYPDVQNCILWYNNAGSEQYAGFSKECVYHSCIYDPNDPNGVNLTQDVNYNFSANPQFAYFDPNNVRITYGSPCREAGNPSMSYDDQVDMDSRVRVLGTRVDIGAYEIDCEDTANLYDWNADGLVNLHEFNVFSRSWLAHDPNDPAWVADPNLTDPNLSEDWYEWKHRCNLVTTGNSTYQVDLADFVVWVEDSPWLWQACWLTDDLLSEQSASGGRENLMLSGIKTMSFETQVIEEKSAIEQAVDLASIIAQLENLWQEAPNIQQEINSDDWNRFMESIYNSFSELEIEAVGAK